MTDTPPKPKRRHWRWLVAVVSIVIGAFGYAVMDVRVRNARNSAWLLEAHRRHLVIQQDDDIFVPGGEYVGPGDVVVTVRDQADVEKLLSMPPLYAASES